MRYRIRTHGVGEIDDGTTAITTGASPETSCFRGQNLRTRKASGLTANDTAAVPFYLKRRQS